MAEPERVPESRYRSSRGKFAADSDDLELADRNALRRVAGLSTELADITEVEYRQLRLERVVLVGVWTEGTAFDAENSLVELAELAKTAGSEVLEGLIQRRSRPDPSTFIGRGKVERAARRSWSSTGADTVICDGELSPVPAAHAGGPGQGQGHRPDRADPRHLRPARQEPRGQGPGRAGPAAVLPAPAAWLGRGAVPPDRW